MSKINYNRIKSVLDERGKTKKDLAAALDSAKNSCYSVPKFGSTVNKEIISG